MATPPGRPCFPHLHLKARLPSKLHADSVYELQAACTNEMDMWDSQDTEGWGSQLPVLTLQVLHPHLHALAPPAVAASSDSPSCASPSPLSPVALSGGLPPARLGCAAVRLAADCKPLLSRGGKAALKFSLSPSPVILGRTLSSWPPNAPLTQPFYLHLSVNGALGSKILPAVSGPHQLFPPAAKGPKSASSGGEKMTYIMGEHGVHHAIFVPLESTSVGGKLPSVYSFPVGPGGAPLVNPPAFVRLKEILGVNLGGRIWDCGLLLFEYLRDSVLHKQPDYFHGRKILEVGSGTGIVGIWLWAYVLLRNRAKIAAADKAGTRRPAIAQTTFLLTDQEEAMDNLRDNLVTNLDLLAGGASECDGVRVEASQLGWGCDEDHRSLAIQPTPEPFDLILASDVVFNPIYFTPLLETLQYISGPRTTILMAYRPRATDRRQDEVFFKALTNYGWTCRKEGKYQDVFMLTIERIQKADTEDAAAAAPSQNEAATATASPSPPPVDAPAAAAAATSDSSVTPAASTAAPLASSSSASASPSSPSSTDSSAALPASSAADSSSRPCGPLVVADDPLSLLLSQDLADVSLGSELGSADALRQVEADGLFAGLKRGKGIAGEFGFYFGFLHMCTLLHQKQPAAYSDRIWNKVTKLHQALLASPLRQSAFDPNQMEDGSALIHLRNSFKALMTQMGVWEHFQQQASEAQAISF